ncbi:MAG: serine/threonine protein kinase [Candidatus Obscuribacterales bacterium]|nr:serine/threonine protein kinase [Candidatus Obscuribacterales bacterium]
MENAGSTSSKERLLELAKSSTFALIDGKISEGGLQETLSILEPGSIIDQKFEVIELLGSGGMGSVYKVRHLHLGNQVALKTFSGKEVRAEAWQRFEREAKSIASLRHPNIISVLDFGINDSRPYYTMELVEGESLAQRIERRGALSERELLYVIARLADALSHSHKKGIIHRDLKPANVYIELSGDQISNLKLADFGVAGLLSRQESRGETKNSDQRLTAPGAVFGSPLYMSPEQSRGEELDARTDIYSLACLIYECVNGVPPFVGATAIETFILHNTAPIPPLAANKANREPSKWIDALYRSMMDKEREARIPTMDEVLDTLEFNVGRKSKKVEEVKNAPDLSKKSTDETAPPLPLKAVLFVGIVIIAIASIGGIAYYTFSKTSKPILKSGELPKPPEATKKQLEVLNQPLSYVRGQHIYFQLPEEDIGAVSINLTAQEKKQFSCSTNDMVKIEFNDSFPDKPEQLNLFAPESLSGIAQSQSITFDWGDEYFPYFARFKRLVTLELDKTNCSGKVIDDLNALPILQVLRLRSKSLNASDIKRLKRLNQLTLLSVSYIGVDKELVQRLSPKKFIALGLKHGYLEEGAIEALGELKGLEVIELEKLSLRNKNLLAALRNLPNLQKLTLYYTNISDQEILALKNWPKKLEIKLKEPGLKRETLRQLEMHHKVINEIDSEKETEAIDILIEPNPEK